MSETEQSSSPTPRFDRRDGVGLLGLAMIGGGAAAIHWPTALIVVGAALVLVAVLAAKGR